MLNAPLDRVYHCLQRLAVPCTIDEEHSLLIASVEGISNRILLRWIDEIEVLQLVVLGCDVVDIDQPDSDGLRQLLHFTYDLSAGGFGCDARDGEVVYVLSVTEKPESVTPGLLAWCLRSTAQALGFPLRSVPAINPPIYDIAAYDIAAAVDHSRLLQLLNDHLVSQELAPEMVESGDALAIALPVNDGESHLPALAIVHEDDATLQWLVWVGPLGPDNDNTTSPLTALDFGYYPGLASVSCRAGEDDVVLMVTQPLIERVDVSDFVRYQRLISLAIESFWEHRLSQPFLAGEGNLVEVAQEILTAIVEGNRLQPVLERNGDLLRPELCAALDELIAKLPIESSSGAGLATIWLQLGKELSDAYIGDRAEIIEAAIICFTHSLDACSRVTSPETWGETQFELGNLYKDRLYGDSGDNVEEAIAALERALDVYTREEYPAQWATIQHNLGYAFIDRVLGKQATNIEHSIEHLSQALTILSLQEYPELWALTQNNLGNAYNRRTHGKRSDNLEQAIACYIQSLEVYTRDESPENWAMVQHNLGFAYRERQRGNRAANCNKAIACFTKALDVYTQATHPVQWANAQNHLGYVCLLHPNSQEGTRIEEAIIHFNLALEVLTFEAAPDEWALIQNNIGNAFSERTGVAPIAWRENDWAC